MANLKNAKTTISIELFNRTYQSEDKYNNLLFEVHEKYGATEFKLERSKDNPKKLLLTFNTETT